MEKVLAFLGSLKIIIISGACIAASLILTLTGTSVLIDPAWAAVALCGFPIMYWAVVGVFIDKKIYTALLITIAMIASIAIGELFAAGEIALIMAIGEMLEEKTVTRAKKGLKNLISLAPAVGRRIIGGAEEEVPADQIKRGDILRVLPGESIPVDGEIITGDTSVDQSVMTGESLPVDKSVGDSVFCGTINRFGAIDIKATKVGEDSSLQKLIRMVQEAENNKAPSQRIADKWASWLVPIALVIAVITFFATGEIIRAVTVLVVFCPCALVLATPTSIVAAIGQATKHGVLIKSGEALERMGKTDMVAFDKTGTLTHGNLTVSDVISIDPNIDEKEFLSLVASAESLSEHPLGKAVTSHAKEQGVALKQIRDFRMIPGKGISAAIGNKDNKDNTDDIDNTDDTNDAEENNLLCGSIAYLSENGVIITDEITENLERFRAQGKAVVLVSINGICQGLVALSDTLRGSSKKMVSELRKVNTGSVLLTGDHKQTAAHFAEQVGITDVYAQLLPAEKVEKIQELQKEGRNVCMIGDGVNDAPALKTAYSGIAMGGMGSDIAIEAADIALMSDDLSKIPYIKRLSNATVNLIKINIIIAMGLNFAAIVLSIMGILTPVTGALWHNAGSVLVVLNAARLYDRKF